MSQAISKITVPCTCGAKLTAPASAAGRRAKCPKCGASLLVKAPELPPEPASEVSWEGLYELAKEERKQSKASGENPDDVVCPNCQNKLGAGIVICTGCGYDTRTGRSLQTVTVTAKTKEKKPQQTDAFGKPQPATTETSIGSFPVGMLYSFLGAMLGALIWWGFFKITGWEFALIASVTGVLAGAGMAAGYKGQDAIVGLIAAGFAFIGICVGRALIIISVYNSMAGEGAMDKLGNLFVLMPHMTDKILQQEGIDPEEATLEQREVAEKKAEKQLDGMTPDQLKALSEEVKLEGQKEEVAFLLVDQVLTEQGVKDDDVTPKQREMAIKEARKRAEAMKPEERASLITERGEQTRVQYLLVDEIIAEKGWDEDNLSPNQWTLVHEEAEKRAATLNAEQRAEVLKKHEVPTDAEIEETMDSVMTGVLGIALVIGVIVSFFSIFSILSLILAISAAYKIATGGGTE